MAPGPTLEHPGGISKPVMFMQGEWDAVASFWTTSALYSEIPASAPDRWCVGIRRAGHPLTYDRCYDRLSLAPCSQNLPQEKVNAVVARWGTPFLLRYVAGDSRYVAWLVPTSGPDYFVVETKAGAAPSPVPTATELFTS
jgi:hypothetical protein